jgi:hypothetical protein
MRTLFIFLLLTVSSTLLLGQQRLPGNQNIYDAEGPGFVYDNEWTFNFGLGTPRNLFLGFTRAKLKAYNKSTFYTIFLGDIRHSREQRSNFERIIPSTNQVSRPFVYGKQNQFYAVRVGFGTRTYLSEKAKQRGVAMGYSWEIGPTLGLLKPYYLEVQTGELNNGTIRDIAYSEDTEALFLDRFRIFGASSWGQGLDELKIIPGVHGRASVHFGFGAYDEMAKSLEVGVQGDFFFRDAPIMVESDLTPGVTNSNLRMSLFLQMQLGKRW